MTEKNIEMGMGAPRTPENEEKREKMEKIPFEKEPLFVWENIAYELQMDNSVYQKGKIKDLLAMKWPEREKVIPPLIIEIATGKNKVPKDIIAVKETTYWVQQHGTDMDFKVFQEGEFAKINKKDETLRLLNLNQEIVVEKTHHEKNDDGSDFSIESEFYIIKNINGKPSISKVTKGE